MKPKTTQQLLAEDMIDLLNEASQRVVLIEQQHKQELEQKDKEYKRLEYNLKVTFISLVLVAGGLIFKTFYA